MSCGSATDAAVQNWVVSQFETSAASRAIAFFIVPTASTNWSNSFGSKVTHCVFPTDDSLRETKSSPSFARFKARVTFVCPLWIVISAESITSPVIRRQMPLMRPTTLCHSLACRSALAYQDALTTKGEKPEWVDHSLGLPRALLSLTANALADLGETHAASTRQHAQRILRDAANG